GRAVEKRVLCRRGLDQQAVGSSGRSHVDIYSDWGDMATCLAKGMGWPGCGPCPMPGGDRSRTGKDDSWADGDSGILCAGSLDWQQQRWGFRGRWWRREEPQPWPGVGRHIRADAGLCIRGPMRQQHCGLILGHTLGISNRLPARGGRAEGGALPGCLEAPVPREC
ncbi:unnamed protein product, partial [Discosporangium mesarthrocarpum]